MPSLREQKAIVDRLHRIAALVARIRATAREQLEAVNAFPAALLRRAFSGEL